MLQEMWDIAHSKTKQTEKVLRASTPGLTWFYSFHLTSCSSVQHPSPPPRPSHVTGVITHVTSLQDLLKSRWASWQGTDRTQFPMPLRRLSIYPFKINKEWEDQKTKDVWETKEIAVLLTLLCVPQAEQYFLHPLGLGMSLSWPIHTLCEDRWESCPTGSGLVIFVR